jgi:hypothetical protein
MFHEVVDSSKHGPSPGFLNVDINGIDCSACTDEDRMEGLGTELRHASTRALSSSDRLLPQKGLCEH